MWREVCKLRYWIIYYFIIECKELFPHECKKKILGKRQKQANSCNNKWLEDPSPDSDSMVTSPQIHQICHQDPHPHSNPELPLGKGLVDKQAKSCDQWKRHGNLNLWRCEYVRQNELYLQNEYLRCLVGKGELYSIGWAVKRVRWTQSEQSFHKDPWSSRLNPWESHKHKCMSKHIPLSHSLISFNTQTHKHDSHCPSAHYTHT